MRFTSLRRTLQFSLPQFSQTPRDSTVFLSLDFVQVNMRPISFQQEITSNIVSTGDHVLYILIFRLWFAFVYYTVNNDDHIHSCTSITHC